MADDKTLKKLFIEQYEKRLDEEIHGIDKDMNFDAFIKNFPFSELPEEWKAESENRYGVKKPKLRKRIKTKLKAIRRRMAHSRAAIFIIIVFVSVLTIMNVFPAQSMAVAKKVSLLFGWGDKSIEIGLKSCWPEISEDFVLTDTKENKNLSRRRYENTEGNYIEVSVYPDTYKITADNEDLDESRELTINGSRAVILSKNNITTIYIYLSGNIMKVESDLSSNETEQIAETIDD